MTLNFQMQTSKMSILLDGCSSWRDCSPQKSGWRTGVMCELSSLKFRLVLQLTTGLTREVFGKFSFLNLDQVLST